MLHPRRSLQDKACLGGANETLGRFGRVFQQGEHAQGIALGQTQRFGFVDHGAHAAGPSRV